MSRRLVIALIVCSLAAFNSRARADATGVRKALEDVKKNISDKDWDQADTNLRLADAEMDGISGADKTALAAEIAAARKALGDAHGSEGRETIIKQLDLQIKMAKEGIGSRTSMEEGEKEINELLNSAAGKALPPDVADKYRKTFATLKKASDSKSADRMAERVGGELDDAEKALPEALKVDPNTPEAARQAQDLLGRRLEMIQKELSELPSNPAGDALKARYAKLEQQYNSASASRDSSEVAGSLQRSWDSYKNDFDGWESENAAGPTFDEFRKESSESMRTLRAPKTVALLSRAESWLEMDTKSEQYNAVKDTPAVKSIVDGIKKMQAAAMAKMEPRAEKLVASAEAFKDVQAGDAQTMSTIAHDVLRLDLPGSPKIPAWQARLEKKAATISGTLAAGQEAKDKFAADMVKAANDAWPKISSGLSGKDVSDPSKLSEGDLVHLKKSNRLGWDYSPGDYNYATTINGLAIAGKFDGNVRAAMKSVVEKSGSEINEEDWDVFGKVEADGKIEKRSSADVQDKGGSNLGTIEGHETVNCKVIRIFAAHAGPLAVGPDGMADDKGGVAAPLAASSGGSGSSASGWFMKFAMALLGLVAAGVAFVKARPEAAAQAVGSQGTTTLVAVNKNLSMIGLAIAVIGVFWLLAGLIYRDFLPAAAMIASGLYASSDLLKSKGLMNESQSAQVKPLGVMIALATAALAIVHFLIGGYPLV